MNMLSNRLLKKCTGCRGMTAVILIRESSGLSNGTAAADPLQFTENLFDPLLDHQDR